MITDEQSSRLDYEAPLERVGGAVGCLAYAFADEGRRVTVTALYDEPLGRGRWIGRVAMVLGAVAMALFLLAGFGGQAVRYGVGRAHVTANPFAFWGGVLLLG